VKAGNARVLVLDLKRGHYALIRSLPGHYKTGQFADFYVR
jgi:type IV secretory pathway VirB4 component